MSAEETVNRTTRPSASRSARLRRAWRALPSERRLAVAAALALFLALFLPWYQETGLAGAGTKLHAATASLTGWAAFSWVEAAVLLVAVGVLALLVLRAEGRAFHLPGGDGAVVTAAGGWTCLLVIWRIFDKQGVTHPGQVATTSGIEWGIFIALGVAGLLAYSGSRIRAAHRPEPLLPGEVSGAAGGGGAADLEPWPEEPAAPTGKRRARGVGAASGAAAVSGAGERAAAQGRVARRAGRRRRAEWAEAVTWDEPTTIAEPVSPSEPPSPSTPPLPSEPALPSEPTAPARMVDSANAPHQLRIPLDDEPAD